MAKSGDKRYMESKWDYGGNFQHDGVSYAECADMCRERSDCAGFDIELHG
jgi:hypothetical protein